ncbi:hypothetical protein AB4X15_03025 [Peribacillus simplex]|uniref:hypothetical protein n=1 Tax=Peribacillus simplex TaxID=1478 RepID=UPI0034E8B912
MSKKEPSSFAWVSYTTELDNVYITVDAHKRLYLSSAVPKKLGLKTPISLYIGYDHANKRLVVAKPEVVKAVDVKPHRFDKRRYCSAKAFIRSLAIEDSELPLRFAYAGKDFSEYPAGAFVFQLTDFVAPDDAMPAE